MIFRARRILSLLLTPGSRPYIAQDAMSRIRKAYETRFRWLLQRVRARKVDQGVGWLLNEATDLSRREHVPFAAGLMRVYKSLAGRPRFRCCSSVMPGWAGWHGG